MEPSSARSWTKPLHSRLAPFLLAGAVVALALVCAPFRYAYAPAASKVLNEGDRRLAPAYDDWGKSVGAVSETIDGALPPGAVRVNDDMLRLGRRAFYEETFGNEIFLTDVLGIIAGPLGLRQYAAAILALGGKPTTNLKLELDEPATIGGQVFERGTIIDTGLDVPAGALLPLGMALRHRGAAIEVGITCAACHSTVDARSGKVIHGAPNSDLNAGVLLAFASNSAAFFPHAALDSLERFSSPTSGTIRASDGTRAPLPDPEKLEQAVDATLLAWPPGYFDSMIDLVAAPTQIPDAFSFESYPYSWSGAFAAGPFRGLSVQTNNVHALNADTLTHADASRTLFGIDKELYLATVLRHAAATRFRYDPARGETPSAFFHGRDPTPEAPGINELVQVPTYPGVSLIAPNGLWNSSPGYRVWEQVNAMSAWQNTLVPPNPPGSRDSELARLGRAVFERAGCPSCHAGPAYTNHRIIPAELIGTEPTRARAFRATEPLLKAPLALAFDQRVPLRGAERLIAVPTDELDPEQVRLGLGYEGQGGYKVKGLIGLYWSAPYLHDGGVAASADATQLGVSGTLLKGTLPDPAASLRALIDRSLRARVVVANEASPRLRAMHVCGCGHEFWVDAPGGYSSREQAALVEFLLTLELVRDARRAEH